MSHSQLPLTALRAFEASARLLSFKQAAQELHVTPTAVSHQIQQLERFLGVKLFVRVHRGLTLTPAARSCLPHVREGFSSLRAAVGVAQRHSDSGLLRVSAPPSFAMRVLMPLAHGFRAAFPEIDLQITTRMREPASNPPDEADTFWRWTEEDDIVIVFGSGGFGGLEVEELTPLSIQLVCSPKFVRTGRLQSIQDVAHLPWIHDDRGLKYGGVSFWSQWLMHAGLQPKGQEQGHHYTHASLAIEAAVRGDGLLVTTSCLCKNELRTGDLVSPFEHSIKISNSYYVLTKRIHRHSFGLFKRWLRSAVRKME
jgi:LysR family glycine cleavage system transcriptional activator